MEKVLVWNKTCMEKVLVWNETFISLIKLQYDILCGMIKKYKIKRIIATNMIYGFSTNSQVKARQFYH